MSSTVLSFLRSWWPIFLALLLISGPFYASAEGDCFASDGDNVNLSAKCTKSNTTIKVSGKDQLLSFQLIRVGGGDANLIPIILNIGGCKITGFVSYGGASDILKLSGPVAFDLPAPAKATPRGVSFTKPDYKVPSCTPKFVPDGDGNLVSISYEADVELPNLEITFSNSKIYVAPEEKDDWGFGGWRLWTVLASVVWVSSDQQTSLPTHFSAVVLFILIMIGFVFIHHHNDKIKQANAEKTAEKHSTMTKSTSTMKNATKNNAKKGDVKNDAKKSREKKSQAKVPGKDDWIENYRWPVYAFTVDDKQYLRSRLQVSNPPMHELLRKHPLGVNESKALNSWLATHRNLYRRKNQLPFEERNQLEADQKMFKLLFQAGKEVGVRNSTEYDD
ncbi:hypothetical protein M3Y98_00082000 [Aphelenchoides besseyi]|nr:hypothetical protein M3Y98_00082000 [Aphelenchoides besseyi]KAI6198642.1 hypothetical protein M3Y96_00540900 [Aphelenchoides besseyi]